MGRFSRWAEGEGVQARCLLSPKDPVYVFHHIPKCGGTSLNRVLDDSLVTIKDYRQGMAYPEKVDLSRLRSCHCLCGHFELKGNYLGERYPEVFSSERFRVFTFVRDPLKLRLSLFRYEMLHNRAAVGRVEEHILLRPNFLANRFPATMDDYKAVIDRYFFVGILEESAAGLALLGAMMGRCLESLPWLNRTGGDGEGEGEGEGIPPELAAEFRRVHALDYLIYDYCAERFGRLLAEHLGADRSSPPAGINR